MVLAKNETDKHQDKINELKKYRRNTEEILRLFDDRMMNWRETFTHPRNS